ncbi:MAG: AAA family ATPase [Gammaproteobacteria bacterium]|nr:AAA family ATPase [Gammaproteobacteria bacterium]MDE0443769.1 AAA family ATPase [Gammaproteobacteria bacterium]
MANQAGSLEIEVSDFGPIVNAKVDLRPFTVFVGPSNTGKSYLAILIYVLHRFFGVPLSLPIRVNPDGSLTVSPRAVPDLPDDSGEALLDLARSFAGAAAKGKASKFTLSRSAADAVRSGFDDRAGILAKELARCFGLRETGPLVRKGRANARVVIGHCGPGSSERVEHALTLARRPEFTIGLPADAAVSVDPEPNERFGALFDLFASLSEDASDAKLRRLGTGVLFSLFGLCVLPAAVGSLCSRAYYLPADRTGAMHLYKLVARTLVADAASAPPGPEAATSMLTGVVADFLGQLIEECTSVADRPPQERDLGENLEAAILDGSVRVEQSAAVGAPQFLYRPHGWKDDLELANASSMVSELAPVVLYLRHLVQPGNVLIVEEPESHLHPAMQVELTRQLAELVAAGIRVIVTTHSEWMIEELANVVRRSKLPESERARVSGSSVALHPTQVGAWLFSPKRRPKGSVVAEVPLEEYGFSGTGFDDVASALHNDWADISGRIEGIP